MSSETANGDTVVDPAERVTLTGGERSVKAAGAPASRWRYQLPLTAYGALLRRLPTPLGIGTIDLIDGRHVLGCLCESYPAAQTTDIT